ncbi:ribosome biogenesis GTPase Der [Candidatus Sordicultor fermentans]|jgi:GTP-binding protein|uniref:ribosome biogenesis GTPase Der n=1 Tax=Candidatus Sordicultor fermentans TaxID=1953203 RepID=UPI0016AA84AD|nr:ribosome biogenesis GTPase Der [Candidatus Atribacteria bacterium]HOA98417.1 ribosome biogenesis GTPase Der [Candidatus Atribacteria bacterium]HQD32490.1 ribosome biogenesis GTPase Der [Candidatus Atribacteria bacterium]
MKEKVPMVAIIGKTNVGKSTLFNHLSRKRVATVDSHPGVTRDFLENIVDIEGKKIKLVDTGGLEILVDSQNEMQKKIEEKTWEVMEKADLLLWVLDGRENLTSIDWELASRLRRIKSPVIIVINKREGMTSEAPPAEFFSLGFEPIIQISATHGDGLRQLRETIAELIVGNTEICFDRHRIPVAIVGKPNVGKSALYNSLLGKERSIVSDIPGTTRDALLSTLDTSFGYYELMDTPGSIARSKIKERIDFYAALRTEESLQDAVIALLVIDPIQGITRQDKRIAQKIKEDKKGCLVFINKSDLVLNHHSEWQVKKLVEEVRRELSFLNYASFLVGSAFSPSVSSDILSVLAGIATRYYQRIKTSFLNEKIREKINEEGWKVGGRTFRTYYMHQKDIAPPRFYLSVNFSGTKREEELLVNRIEKLIRKEGDWEGVPISIELSRE